MDGFYRAEHGREYFIKKPEDKKELFTELFAGLILKTMMKKGLIHADYHPSLICADVIEVADGEYALIQNVASFTELFKIINTGYRDQSDRSPLIEMLAGPSYYPALTQDGSYFGLSTALMFSLLLGANSVHSGNVVVLNNTNEDANDDGLKQFARLDWGDAFRHFCDPDNNKDVLWPKEYQGLNYKGTTKGYFFNYKNLTGLFPAMADKAQNFKFKLQREGITLREVVSEALSQIPADLIDEDTQQALARYLGSETLTDTRFGEAEGYAAFGQEISEVLENRLQQITELTNFTDQNSNATIYRSTLPSKSISYDESLSFPDQINAWSDPAQAVDITIDEMDVPALTAKFNHYVSALARQAELCNLWPKADGEHASILTDHSDPENTAARFGFAFVPEMRESAIIRTLHTIMNHTKGMQRPAAYEDALDHYIAEHQDSEIAHIRSLLTSGLNIINQLDTIQRLQQQGCDDDDSLEIPKSQLTDAITRFNENRPVIDAALQSKALSQIDDNDTSSFYPISRERLHAMSGDQLVTLCLEEINHETMTQPLQHILSDDTLWQSMRDAFYAGDFNQRKDNPNEKMARLVYLREALQRVLEQHEAELAIAHSETQSIRDRLEAASAANEALQASIQALTSERTDQQSMPQDAIERIEVVRANVKQTLAQLQENREAAEKASAQAAEDRVAAERDRAHIAADRSAAVDALAQATQDRAAAEQAQAQAAQEHAEAKQAQAQAAQDRAAAEQAQAQAAQDRAAAEEALVPSETQQGATEAKIARQKAKIRALKDDLAQQETNETQVVDEDRFNQVQHLLALACKMERMAEKDFAAESDAYVNTHEIVKHIRDESQRFIQDKDYQTDDFKSELTDHINQRKAPLENHRGMRHLIANVLLAIALLGVGYLAAAGVKKLATGSYTFFNDTKCKRQLAELDETIQEFTPGTGN